jgi:hypothetical protein
MVTITVQGLDQLIERFEHKRTQIISEVTRVIGTHAANLSGSISTAAPRGATNKLANSVAHKIRVKEYVGKNGAKRTWIQGKVNVGVRTKYVRYVEFGTLSKRDRKLPPCYGNTAFVQWANSKGISPFVAALGVARRRRKHFLNATALAADSTTWAGTEPHPFIYPTWNLAKQPYAIAVRQAISRAIQA